MLHTMTLSLAVPDILVARARAGDEEALEALFRAFETPVYNLARRMLRNAERQPPHYRDAQKSWLDLARQSMQA